MGAETFKLSGGACKSNSARVVAELAERGIASSASNGVVTVTRTDLDGNDARERFDTLVRLAKASSAKLAYVVSS